MVKFFQSKAFGEIIKMNIVNCVDWQAIGAIGTWVSGLGTILAVVVAVLPYIKKENFILHSIVTLTNIGLN